jgi:putative sigma-54 modulation protein
MNVTMKGVHYDISDATREYVDKRLERLSYARDMIQDLNFTFTREKSGWTSESNVHFRWKQTFHVKTTEKDLYPAIDALFDKLDHKIEKEKGKIKDHHSKEAVREAEA